MWMRVSVRRLASVHRPGAAALLGVLALSFGCRAIESPEELPSLAGETQQELPAAGAGPSSAGAGGAATESLDSFPLVGSAFPGLGGRLHSSLCDPASDPYSTCI